MPAFDLGDRSGSATHVAAYQLVHRHLLADLGRVSDDVGRLTAARAPELSADTGTVLTRLESTLTAIDLHCRWEDRALWPLLAAAAGAAVDVRPLLEDHSEVQALLRSVDAAADALRTRPPDVRALAALCVRVRDLQDVLREHIGEEERDVVPVLAAYVRAEDYERVRRGILAADVVGSIT